MSRWSIYCRRPDCPEHGRKAQERAKIIDEVRESINRYENN